MIPLGDDVPRLHFPFATYVLIALNILGFFYELQTGTRVHAFIATWGTVPVRFADWTTHPWVLLTLITSMFLHAGLWHIAGNMIFLAVFGPSVEDDMGSRRFMVFYLLAGLAAGLAQVFMAPASQIPELGASGAIAGVLGAYLVLFPRAHVIVYVPPIFLFTFSATFVLVWWFVIQIFGAFFTPMAKSAQGGVAYWAHIGGFAFGAMVVRGFANPARTRFRHYPLDSGTASHTSQAGA